MAIFATKNAAAAYPTTDLAYGAHSLIDRIAFQTIPGGLPAVLGEFNQFLHDIYDSTVVKGALLRGFDREVSKASDMMSRWASLTTSEKEELEQHVKDLTVFIPFEMLTRPQANSSKFEEYFAKVNDVRLGFYNLAFQTTVLEKTGEEHYQERNRPIPPVPPANHFRRLSVWEKYVTLHRTFIQEAFGTPGNDRYNSIAQFELKYYLLAQAETPYKTFWFLKKSSIPFWPSPPVRPANLNQGHKKVYIQFSGTNSTDIFAQTIEDFYKNAYGFNNYPRVVNVTQEGGKPVLWVHLWKSTFSPVDVVEPGTMKRPLPRSGTVRMFPEEIKERGFGVSMSENGLMTVGAQTRVLYDGGQWSNNTRDAVYQGGSLYLFSPYKRDNFHTEPAKLDVYQATNLTGANMPKYRRNKFDKIGSEAVLKASLQSGQTVSDWNNVKGYPILKDSAGKFYILARDPNSGPVSATRPDHSGLTIGWGFDLLNGPQHQDYRNAIYTFLKNTTGGQFDSADATKKTMIDLMFQSTEEQSQLAAIKDSTKKRAKFVEIATGKAGAWMKLRPNYDYMDMSYDTNHTFALMIIEGKKVADQYQFKQIEKIIKDGGGTMNQVEWFAVVAIFWNAPAIFISKDYTSTKQKFIDAIKAHSYDKLVKAVEAVPTWVNNRGKVLGLLTGNVTGTFEGAKTVTVGGSTVSAVKHYWNDLNK